MAFTQEQLQDLIDSNVNKNNRNLIDGPKMNRVLHAIVESCFNETGANMANAPLEITGNFLHDGSGNSWGIGNLSQLFFGTSVPPSSGASIKLQGYGSGADNQLFSVQNGFGTDAMLINGNLNTTFGGRIGVRAPASNSRIINVEAQFSDMGIYVQSQSGNGVYINSSSGIGLDIVAGNYGALMQNSSGNSITYISGEDFGVNASGSAYGVLGYSAIGVGLNAVSITGSALRTNGKTAVINYKNQSHHASLSTGDEYFASAADILANGDLIRAVKL